MSFVMFGTGGPFSGRSKCTPYNNGVAVGHVQVRTPFLVGKSIVFKMGRSPQMLPQRRIFSPGGLGSGLHHIS